MPTIETEIRQFVVENLLFGDDADLANTDSFLDRALIDSTGVLELVAFVEQRYRIAVDDHEIVPANLDSVVRLAGFVERKLHGVAPEPVR